MISSRAVQHLSKLQQQYKDQHVYVVGVTQEDDAKVGLRMQML